MKTSILLGQASAPDGTIMRLIRRGEEFIILANGENLMSSRVHGSEDAIATIGCAHAQSLKRPRVLIGGLGMGFSLRSALDLLPPAAEVVVAELVGAIVDWNRGPLGPLAGDPLKDRRVQLELNDVALTLRSRREYFDAVLLDVDNGPAALSAANNARLYDDSGVAAVFAALKTKGVLAVWSAREDQKFAQRLRRGGFAVEVKRVRGRLKKGGAHHVVFVGRKI